MPSLRTPEMKERYKEYAKNNPASEACPLCEKTAIKTFTYWKITENQFPYDLIAKTHHMVLPLRHVKEDDLTAEEREEFSRIKRDFVNTGYDYIIEATPQNKSLPDHFHIHIVIGK